MPQNKYKYHDWEEYFRGGNVLNCNAAQQQSGPCGQKVARVDKTKCGKECENVFKELSVQEAMRKGWLERISEHRNSNARYEEWEPRKRKHFKAFFCRDQPECRNQPKGQDCKMCERVVRDTQKEYNERVRTINKLGLRFKD